MLSKSNTVCCFFLGIVLCEGIQMNLVCFYVFFIAVLGMTGALLESDVAFLGNDRGVFSKFLCVLMRKGEVFFV